MPLFRCGYLRTIKCDMAMVKRCHCECNGRYQDKFGKLQKGRFKYFTIYAMKFDKFLTT
jgi:hypothetical protein